MSTKNIARSALEGGRAGRSKYDRNQSHRTERARTRNWVDKVQNDNEEAYESDPEPRKHVMKDFTDKLRPCWGWLASNAGRPWSKVFSELTSKFDTRKLSSWHIVNQHMLTEVEGAGATTRFFHWGHTRFYVDDHGILRDRGWYRSPYRKRTGPSRDEVLAVVGDRMVNDYGNVQFWAERVDRNYQPGEYYRYRQTVRFTEAEARWWATVHDKIKKDVSLAR